MLTESQRNRLQTIHSYEWAESCNDADANLSALYSAIESTEELWFASFIIPLDPGKGQLSMVLDHPACDRSIASFIYWTLDPCAAHDEPVSLLIAEIERRIVSGHYPNTTIRFSPSMLKRTACGRIPDDLCQTLEGLELPIDYREVFTSKPT
ncbi:MAG: hypothetical protein ACK6A8_18295 [Planctomycetota bacterium]|jgi:hypothetical protein